MDTGKKAELYNDLTTSLLEKNVDVVVSNIKEIVLVPGETNNLLCYFIEFYAENRLTSNVFILSSFVQKLKAASSVPKRGISTSPIFLTEVIDAALILLNMTNCKVPVVDAYDISTIEAEVSNMQKKRHEELLHMQDKVTTDMYTILNIIYYKTRYQDKKSVLGFLFWLTSLKSCAVEEIVFDEIKSVKFRNDVIWYIWQLALSLVHNRMKVDDIVMFVKDHLYLFTFLYQKKHRATRMNILLYVFGILSSKNVLKHVRFQRVDLETYNESKKESEPSSKNYDYLKCFTYFNIDLVSSVKMENELKKQGKSEELRNVNGL